MWRKIGNTFIETIKLHLFMQIFLTDLESIIVKIFADIFEIQMPIRYRHFDKK